MLKQFVLPINVKVSYRAFGSSHKCVRGGIEYRMFTDELFAKLKIDDAFAGFTITLAGDCAVAVGGAKAVLFSSDEEVKIRLPRKTACVFGEELRIVEIGGGDVLVRGKIGGVRFE